jgi:hypothetical protein
VHLKKGKSLLSVFFVLEKKMLYQEKYRRA